MEGNVEPKSLLNQYLQRYLARSITKNCIEYKSSKIQGSGYQTVVKLNCLATDTEPGPEIAGEVSATQKEAEKAAALQAIEMYRPVVEALPEKWGKGGQKRKALPDPSMAAEPGQNAGGPPEYKSLLNEFIQKNTGCSLKKGDIEYKMNKIPGQGYQAIVKLNVLAQPGEDGPEFAGELSQDQKTAEKSAAFQALEMYGGLGAVAQAGVKVAVSGSSDQLALAPLQLEGQEPASKIPRLSEASPVGTSFKADLNTGVGKIIRQPLAKSDMTFAVTYQPGIGYVGQVQITCLPGEYAGAVFQGQPESDKKQAEQAAAQAALEELRKVPDFAIRMDAPKAEKKKPNKGKGKGKGKGRGGFSGVEQSLYPNPHMNMSMVPGAASFDMSLYSLGMGFQQPGFMSMPL